jgi:hypothetical protein
MRKAIRNQIYVLCGTLGRRCDREIRSEQLAFGTFVESPIDWIDLHPKPRTFFSPDKLSLSISIHSIIPCPGRSDTPARESLVIFGVFSVHICITDSILLSF